MKKGWLIAGAILGCSMGASLGACSSSSSSGTGNSTTTTGTTTTSVATGGTTTATTSTTATATGGSTTTTTGTGDCGTVSKLHPPEADAGMAGTGPNIYCPFSATTDGGENMYCTADTQHCCETPSGSSTPSGCQPTATACATGSTDWGCQDPVADCPAASPVCCAPGATLVLGMPAGQCGNYASEMKSTLCVATVADCTGIIMCTSTAECPSGKTCTPFEKAAAQVGGCM